MDSVEFQTALHNYLGIIIFLYSFLVEYSMNGGETPILKNEEGPADFICICACYCWMDMAGESHSAA